jgi:hypothetical protein
MPRLLCCGVIVVSVVVGGLVRAEDQAPTVQTSPERMLKDFLPTLVKIIDEFGQGRVEAGVELLTENFTRPLKREDGPFQPDERLEWLSVCRPFEREPHRFESVEVIGTRQVGTNAGRVFLGANGKFGPVLFHFDLHCYRGRARIMAWSCKNGADMWENMVETAARYSPPEPMIFELQAAASGIEAETKSANGKRGPVTRSGSDQATAHLAHWAELVRQVGLGDSKRAADMLFDLASVHADHPSNPFRSIARDTMQEMYQKIAGTEYERIEYVASQRATAQAQSIYLLAHGKYGPHLFHFDIYRYGGRWNQHRNYRISVGVPHILEVLEPIAFPEPQLIQLATMKQQVAEQKSEPVKK